MKRPRCSLRLLLVAMAVFCTLLAWERSVVLRRRAMLEQWAYGRRVQITTGDDWAAMLSRAPHPLDEPAASVSWIRLLLGDTPVQRIVFDETTSAYEFERATWLFREASVFQAGPRP